MIFAIFQWEKRDNSKIVIEITWKIIQKLLYDADYYFVIIISTSIFESCLFSIKKLNQNYNLFFSDKI